MSNADDIQAMSHDDRPSPRAMSPLHVALLGDRELCSACLKALLRESDDAITAVDVKGTATLRPRDGVDVALLPLFCPQADLLTDAAETAQTLGHVPLVLLVDRADAQTVSQLVALGVRGVLTLDVEAKIVAAALRLVVAGGIYVPPRLSERGTAPVAAPRWRGKTTAGRLGRLSPRERTVLDLVCRSLPNREIAHALGIAEATVKIHVRNLLRKTQARNRVELALLAVRGG